MINMELQEFKREVKYELMPKIEDCLDRGMLKEAYDRLSTPEEISLFLTLILHTAPEKLANIVTEIPAVAFHAMPVPSHVVIPEGITSIGKAAFHYCDSLKSITLPASITELPEYAFAGSGLRKFTFHDSLKFIGPGAFADCNKLTDITIPGSVEHISAYAFRSCRNLNNVDLDEGIVDIGGEAFAYCQNLESVLIPKSINHLSRDIFKGSGTNTSAGAVPLIVPKKWNQRGCCTLLGAKKSQIDWY